jgi:anti-sigma B factor antagonist
MDEPVRMGEQPAEPLRIDIIQPRSDVAVLRLQGDLDLLTAPLLRETLRSMPDRADCVLVDLTGIEFLGSAGLAELAAAQNAATGAGARIVLVASSRAVLRPLEVTGLHTLFQIFESEEAALANL